MRRRDVGQRQINVEKTLCISTLKCATANNVESTLCISTLTWTTLDNVETTLSFSTSSFTMLVNVETTLRNWTKKRTNIIISNRIQEIQSFNYYFVIFTFLPMLRVIFWRVLAKLRKFLKDYEKYCIART